jgi:hypothetical protein
MAGLDKFLYRLARKGEIPFVKLQGKTVSSIKVLAYDSAGKILLATGTTVPSDSGAGYAKGCIFIDTDVGAGSQGMYINVGTTAACNFDVITTIGTGDVGTTELADNSVTTDKLYDIARGSLIVGGASNAPTALNAKTSGQILVGDGTDLKSVAVAGDVTLAANGTVTIGAKKVLSTMLADAVLHVDKVSISKTDILTATTIKTLVAAPATGYYLEFVSATLTFKYATAQYTGGGNISIGWVGGAALTGIASAANSFGKGSDTILQFVPLSTAANTLVKETALGLQTAGQFTDPGTAAGTAEVTIAYRILPIET